MTVGSCGIPAFEIGINGSVFAGDQHPTWFASPRRRGDDCFEIVSCVEHLRSRHEGGLLSRKIGGEVFVKLRGIEVSKTVCCFLYRGRLTEVTREALSDISLIFSNIWHVGRDVDQSGDGWIVPRFGNYCSAITVTDQNAWSILLSKDTLRGSHIFFKRGFRFLDDADVVTIPHKNVVN